MAPHPLRSLALIGYRGTGKSTVAQRLALRLGWEWTDADVEIEQRAGKSIAALFEDDGEAGFRDLESRVVADLCQRENVVIALGGGAVLRDENRQALARCGAVVWLRATVDAILTRLTADPMTVSRRPRLTNLDDRQEIDRVLAARTPIYRACATLEVDTEGKAPDAVADEILAALGRTT